MQQNNYSKSTRLRDKRITPNFIAKILLYIYYIKTKYCNIIIRENKLKQTTGP